MHILVLIVLKELIVCLNLIKDNKKIHAWIALQMENVNYYLNKFIKGFGKDYYGPLENNWKFDFYTHKILKCY